MKKKILGLLTLVTIIVAISGCTDSNNSDQNFTTELNKTGNADSNDSNSDSNDSTGSENSKLIDTGSSKGNSYTYSWKTYKNSDEDIVIYTTYKTEGETVKQTITVKADPDRPDELVNIFIKPKASGQSSWSHLTSKQGYNTVVEYYWGAFRNGYLENGPSE